MRRDVMTDWTVRDDVRAKLRSSIKRLLVRYKYAPDKHVAPSWQNLEIKGMERGNRLCRIGIRGRRASTGIIWD